MKHGEKIAAIASGFVFLVAVVWFFAGGEASSVGASPPAGADSFEVVSFSASDMPSTVEWGQPTAQGSPNWIFDIFTPPVIYYDEESGIFTVTPPFPGADSTDNAFELQLVAFRPEPFRFQLVSYAGAKGNYVLTLEDLETGKDVFCSPSELLSGLGVKVIDFSENRVVAASNQVGTTEAFDLVGEAVVEVQASGKRFTLRHDEITYRDKPKLEFRTNSDRLLYLQEGESWGSEIASYRVQSVNMSQQSVTMQRMSAETGETITQILYALTSENKSDLSNRNAPASNPPPGAF